MKRLLPGAAACGAVLFLLVFLLPGSARAQLVGAARAFLPALVTFDEDPLRQHGLQVQSFCTELPGQTWTLVTTVPPDKRFIITDVEQVCSGEGVYLELRSSPTSPPKAALMLVRPHLCRRISSGIAFEPGESIYALQSWLEPFKLTLCGYFVEV